MEFLILTRAGGMVARSRTITRLGGDLFLKGLPMIKLLEIALGRGVLEKTLRRKDWEVAPENR